MEIEPVLFAIIRAFFQFVNLSCEGIQTLSPLIVEGPDEFFVAFGQPPDGKKKEDGNRTSLQDWLKGSE